MATMTMDSVRGWLQANASPSQSHSVATGNSKIVKEGMYFVSLIAVVMLAVKWWTQRRTLAKKQRDLALYGSGKEFGGVTVDRYASSKMEKTVREPGTWTPIDFQRPTATPYPNWSVTDTKPLPYRPFRHGAYHVTMGLRQMAWTEWIELDNLYLKYHADKAARIAERGEKCIYTTDEPQVHDATVELLEELCAYLSERYPSMFTKTSDGVMNTVTDETFSIPNLTVNGRPEPAMSLCARLVQDDLAIMFERPDGQYYLLAGAVLLAGFWRLSDKIGMPLSEIHTSGNVPKYREKLEKGMNNFFRRIKPDAAVVRNNYFMQVDDNLPWSTSIGSEDVGDEKSAKSGWKTAEKNKAIEHHHFRTERQSLRRLPRSGGVVFTIRTYFHPVTEIAEEPYVPARLAEAVRSWGPDVANYKGRERYEEVLLEFLDNKHREQVEKGVVEEEVTESGKYPY